MAENMTREEAIRIIQETFEFGTEFDNAVVFLKENDPQNPIVAGWVSEEELDNVKKERAKAYLKKALDEDEFDDTFNEALSLSLLKEDKAVVSVVGEEQELFDKQNHTDQVESDGAVLRNVQKIDTLMADWNYETIKQDKNFADLAEVIDHVEIVKDHEEGKPEEPADEKETADYWNVVLENARQQAAMLRSGDMSFFLKKDDEKRAILRNDVKNFTVISVAKGAAVGAMDEPSAEQTNPHSKEFADYITKQTQKAERALNGLFEGGSKVVVKTSSILNETVDTSRKLFSYAARWGQKGFNRIKDTFTNRGKEFNTKMRNFWGKSYEVKQAVVEQVKNNKYRLIADTAATGIVALSAASGVGLPAVAGYALYTAAGSWVWPLIEKKTKAIREAKKAGKSTKEWEGVAGVKKAFAEIKADKKGYKQYKNRAYTGTAFGIAGAGLVAGVGAASGWMVDKAGYVTARAASSIVRSIGSVTSQWLNLRDTKKDFKDDPSAENRERLKQAKIGLGVGAVIAMAGNWMGFSRVLESNTETGNGGFLEKIRGLFNKEDAPSVGENAEVASVAEPVVAATNAADVADAFVTAPTEYDASMGISESQWDRMHRDMTGIYENHAKIFGMENMDQEIAWDNMYQNLDDMEKQYPDLFKDMTKEQFLFKYMMVVEQTERAEYVTKKVGGKAVKFLVTKLDKDGMPTYGSITGVMRSLNDNILGCKTTKIDVKAVKDLMDNVTDSGRYVGQGHDVGVTNNYFVGARTQCGENYQNAWRAGKRIVSQPQPIEEQHVVENQIPTPQPAEVQDVVENRAPDPQATEVQDVVENKKPSRRVEYVLSTGSTDSPQGSLSVESVKDHSDHYLLPTGGRER